MRILTPLFTLTLLFGWNVFAKGGHSFGFNVGTGLPYLSQAGLNYAHSSGMFSAEIGYGAFNLSVDDVGVSLTKTELSLRWHPFAGAFYLGAGIGQQTLSSKATDTISGQSIEAKLDVTSSVLTPQMGWQWGVADRGFWVGLDFGMQSPSGAKSTLTTNADSTIQATAEYQKMKTDTEDQGQKFGEASLPVFSFLRLGYLF